MTLRKSENSELLIAYSPRNIDWDAMHSIQTEETSFIGKGSDCWDRYARSSSIGEIDQNYIDELMPRLKLTPEMSVMDIGCGNGGISIALAERVKRVVALDFSEAALESLKRKIQDKGYRNIEIIHNDFSQQEIGRDLDICDAVLASRSLPMGNLRESLGKIDRAARRLCYVVTASSDNELTKMLCSETGKEYNPFPEYIITPNLLYTMGIHANIEMFQAKGAYYFTDMDEVLAFALLGSDVEDESTREKLINLIRPEVVPYDKGYKYNYRKEFALVWWEKNN